MAVYKRDIVDINLETGNIHRSFLKHSIGYKDQQADHFGIRAYRNGEPVNLTGVSIQGIFMPPQGSPIAITSGNIVNYNEAEVVLPQACYNYDGQFTLAIKLVDPSNAVTGTMRIVDGMVDNTHASGTVAPVAAIPSYQEVLSTYEQAIAAINKTVRFDAVQSLTDTQKATARGNISAPSVADLQAEEAAREAADTALGGRVDDEETARANADTAINNTIGTVPSGKTVQGQIDTLESGKVPKTTTVNGHALSADVTVTKGDVGLGNVDNTSDANKPISTAQAAVNTQVSNIIGNTSLPTTAQTLTGAIAEHEGDLTNQQGQITDLKSALKREVSDINGLHGYADAPCDMIINSSKKWTNATQGTHLVILVNPGDTVDLTANNSYSTIIAMLQTYEPVHGETPTFSAATGYTDRISTTKNTSASFTVPSDSPYLYVMASTSGNSYLPKTLKINGNEVLVGVREMISLVEKGGLHYLGGVTGLGLTQFADIDDIGYVYFTSTSIGNITDKPDGFTSGGVCLNYPIPGTQNKFQVIYGSRKMYIRNITSSSVIEWTELTEPSFKYLGGAGSLGYTSFADAKFGFFSFTTAQGQAMSDKPENMTTGGICSTYTTTASGKYQIIQSTRGMWYRYISSGGSVGSWFDVNGSGDDTNYLAGKKFSIIGDSISTYQGYIPSGYAYYYPANDTVEPEKSVDNVSKTWWKIVETNTGMVLLKNASWSGSGVCFGINTGDTLDNARVAYSDNRINDLADRTDPNNVIEPDIVIVLIGTNDFRKATSTTGGVGNFTETSEISGGSTEITMFNDAYACMLNKIHNAYPNAHVFCCTLLSRSSAGDRIYPVTNDISQAISQYNTAIDNVATWLNCNVIRTDSVFNLANMSDYTLEPTAELHPNSEGMKLLANRIIQGLIDKERKFV